MKNDQIFALVGPAGAGKSELLARLKHALPEGRFVFLRDSSGCWSEYAPPARFTARVTELAKEGIHSCTTARSQLLLFWSRLEANIGCVVKPNLDTGKIVIMDGFGGTILACTLQCKKRSRGSCLDRSSQKHDCPLCHRPQSQTSPTYLLLKPSPEVAYKRLASLDKPPVNSTEALEFITVMNAGFDFYSKLPGQTVRPIDAEITS